MPLLPPYTELLTFSIVFDSVWKLDGILSRVIALSGRKDQWVIKGPA